MSIWPWNIERIFEILVYLQLTLEQCDQIPQPFEGEAAMDFTDKLYRLYVQLHKHHINTTI